VRRSRPLAVVLTVAVLGLSGCGLTDAGVEPGAAVRIEDETISVGEVDDVAAALCSVLQTSPQQSGTVLAGAELRTAAEQGLALGLMGDELLAAYDLELPASADDGADQVRLSYGDADPDDLATALPAFTGGQHFNNVLTALGTDELGTDAEPQAVIAAGVARAQEWQAGADIATNPLFGSFEIGDESILSEPDRLAVAVSDEARAADSTEEGGAEQLPPSQRCAA
jgi:stage V sporulation protein SpoVS